MDKRMIQICCALLLTVNLSYGDFFHTWNQLTIGGFQMGVRDVQTRDVTFGIHGIFNTSLTHTPYNMRNHGHRINTGIIGMANYLVGEDRFTASIVPTTGAYIDNIMLFQIGAGPSYDSLYGVGVATQIILTAKINEYYIGNNETFGSLYLQWNYQTNRQNKIIIGISISSGSLISDGY